MPRNKSAYIDPSVRLFDKSNLPKLILAAVTGVLIAVTYVLFHADFPSDLIQLLPLYVSLFVMLLQTNASRYAFLLGGINSVFYAVVFVSFHLYASALQAFAVSFPLQIISFIRWGRHSYGKSTVFRRLGWSRLALCAAWLGVLYAVFYLLFSRLGAEHLLLDNSIFLISSFVTLLNMLAFIEYLPLQCLTMALNVYMYINLAVENHARVPYAVYYVYSAVCLVFTFIRVWGLYRQQQAEAKQKTDTPAQ